MNKRKSQNRKLIDSLINQEESEKEKEDLIDEILQKYADELKEYTFVDYDDFLLNVRLGGYIRYVNLKNELRWGGILIKIENFDTREPLLTLMNTNKRVWTIKFSKHYIFYRPHRTYNDRLREVFMAYIN